MQHNHFPRCKLQVNSEKNKNNGQDKQDPYFPCLASNLLGKVLAM